MCENSIKILEIQREAKKPQKVNEFIIGSQIQKEPIYSMFRYQIIIEYDGTKHSGWQSQKNAKSIQKDIEKNFV